MRPGGVSNFARTPLGPRAYAIFESFFPRTAGRPPTPVGEESLMAFFWISLKFPRFSLATALLCMSGFVSSTRAASAADLRTMSAADIRGLQQRLADGKCYAGAIDGTANPATEAAIKACPVMDPILSVETGMHTHSISRVAVDRECRLLATGSYDKTVRLWSLPEGRLLRTLRPPIGPKFGPGHVVALSPDGRLVAVSGDARGSS